MTAINKAMNRVDIMQRLLAGDDALGASIGAQIGATTEPFSDGFKTEASAHSRLATTDVAAANHRAGDGPGPWQHLPLLFPELADSSPAEMLDAFASRFRKNPSDRTANLLQAAINRVTASECLRTEHAAAVRQAKALLHTGKGLSNPTAADDIFFEIYTDADFRGPEYFTSMTPGFAYWRVPDLGHVRAVYSNVPMNDVTSSIEFGASESEAGGQVILFEHTRYRGRYVDFSVPRGGQQRIPYIGSDFNDLATSALIIRRWPNETAPISLGQLIQPGAITQIVNSIPRVFPNGDPIFTWDMWPTGPYGSDWHPNEIDRTYLQVIVPVRIGMPDPWPAHHAEIKYWIFPFVSNGQLFGFVDYWGYWLDGGDARDIVEVILRLMIPRTVGQVDNLVNRAVLAANAGGPFRFCYFLPGLGAQRGNVRDGVRVVGVR